MHIQKATKYLKEVSLKKQHVLVHCYKWWSWEVCTGRTVGLDGKGWWPPKSAEVLLHRLKNAETNAGLQGLDVDSLVTEHIQVK